MPLRSLVNSRSVVGAYIGSGLQLFVGGTVIVWIPSYLNRYYAMATDAAGGVAAMIVLVAGMGMIACGMLSDRLCRNGPERKFSLAIAYCLASCVLLSLAFALPHGTPQLVMIALGMFLAAGTSGPAGAMVANLTPLPIHGTAFAMLTLVNNLLGLAAGPLVTGLLADSAGPGGRIPAGAIDQPGRGRGVLFRQAALPGRHPAGGTPPPADLRRRTRCRRERQQPAHDRHPFRPDLPLVLHRQAPARAARGIGSRRAYPEVAVESVWHPVQLLPDVPEQGLPFAEFYERRLGSPEAVRQRRQQIALAAQSVGLDLDLTRIERMPNTARAHQLLRRVAALGEPELYEALLDRLFAAYFQRGEDIGDAATLRALAAEVGVPADRLADATPGDASPAADEAGHRGRAAFRVQRALCPCPARTMPPPCSWP